MRRLALFGVAAIVLGVSLAACASSEDTPANAAIFKAAPWTGEESYTYNLRRRGEDSSGTCTLVTGPVDAGQLKLSRLCGKDEFRDDGAVTVDAATLVPSLTVRVSTDSNKNKRAPYTKTAEPPEVTFSTDVNGRFNKTTRPLPAATEAVSQPAWYDDEQVLWLVRGINLASGAKADYTLVINAGQPSIHTVNVRVDPSEKVSVPAGEFEAWKVRLNRGGNVNYIWVETAGARRVVKAQIEDVTYELMAAN